MLAYQVVVGTWVEEREVANSHSLMIPEDKERQCVVCSVSYCCRLSRLADSEAMPPAVFAATKSEKKNLCCMCMLHVASQCCPRSLRQEEWLG